jgi:hypothetical protein
MCRLRASTAGGRADQRIVRVSGQILGVILGKIGRNERCPCGSGKKYKRCHGAGKSLTEVMTDPNIERLARISLMRDQARQKEIEAQFGLGRPPISAEVGGYRFVAVGPELHYSRTWKTFPDFLMGYFKTVMGAEWGQAQLAKPPEQRHPLFTWYAMTREHQKKTIPNPGEPASAPMTGAMFGIMWLTYGLYLLRHNAEIQNRLLQRLRAPDPVQIFGAVHEVRIAAAMIRAGFTLELEDEADGSQTHCEFTAASKATGKRFSVEVKVCDPGNIGGDKNRTIRQLSGALSKSANHARIVCIELNKPPASEGSAPGGTEQLLRREMKRIQKREKTLKINGEPAPPAYVLLSNFSYRYTLGRTNFGFGALLEGFKIPGLARGTPSPSPRALSEFREQHADPLRFAQTLIEMRIPNTLDGELPGRAFVKGSEPRMLVGERYIVKDGDGRDVVGELIQGLMLENEMNIGGLFRLRDGSTIFCKVPLTEAELEIYRESPETFFGVYEPKAQIEDLGHLYEWLLSAYKDTPHDRLLELLKDHPDVESLRKLSQAELARTYADRTACSFIAMRRPLVVR